MNLYEIKELLISNIGKANVIENADMSLYTSFKTGGKAALLITLHNIEQLRYTLYVLSTNNCNCGNSCHRSCKDNYGEYECLQKKALPKSVSHFQNISNYGEYEYSQKEDCGSCCSKHAGVVPYMLIGNGSNLLVNDGGYNGILIKLSGEFEKIEAKGNFINVGSAALLSKVARVAAENELTGFEFASGIPGTIGGGVFMNAGAYGGEMKDVIYSVQCISKDGSREYLKFANEIDLSYRHSEFIDSGDIIVKVVLTLKKGCRDEILAQMKELSEKRNSKQPTSLPSAGSFFKRPAGHFAATLIEEAGLKGLSCGDAQISPKHAGFVVNNGKATATDIIELMKVVQNTVYDQKGIMLEPEVRIIGKPRD